MSPQEPEDTCFLLQLSPGLWVGPAQAQQLQGLPGPLSIAGQGVPVPTLGPSSPRLVSSIPLPRGLRAPLASPLLGVPSCSQAARVRAPSLASARSSCVHSAAPGAGNQTHRVFLQPGSQGQGSQPGLRQKLLCSFRCPRGWKPDAPRVLHITGLLPLLLPRDTRQPRSSCLPAGSIWFYSEAGEASRTQRKRG